MRKKIGKIIAMTALTLMMSVTSVFAAASGDANLDGKTDLNDAKIILKAGLGISTITDEQAKINADINEDGKIDLTDAKHALKKALGITDYSLDYKYGDSKANIYYNVAENENGVTLFVRNGRTALTSVSVNITYYNGDTVVGSKRGDNNYAFESNKESIFYFSRPYDIETATYPAYDKYKIEIISKDASVNVFSSVESIKYTMEQNDRGSALVGTFTNSYSKKFSFVNATVVFYDSEGNIIDTVSHYVYCTDPGSTDSVMYFYPTDADGKTIVPADYKVYVNYAYGYNY